MLDVAGSRPWRECKRVLSPGATVVVAGGPKANRWIGPLSHFAGMRVASMRGSQKAVPFISKLSRDDLLVLQGLLEDGSVTPAIDRRYALSEAAETLRYLGEGHAQGKVVITV